MFFFFALFSVTCSVSDRKVENLRERKRERETKKLERLSVGEETRSKKDKGQGGEKGIRTRNKKKKEKKWEAKEKRFQKKKTNQKKIT